MSNRQLHTMEFKPKVAWVEMDGPVVTQTCVLTVTSKAFISADDSHGQLPANTRTSLLGSLTLGASSRCIRDWVRRVMSPEKKSLGSYLLWGTPSCFGEQ